MKGHILLKDIAHAIKARRFKTPKAVAQRLGTTERFVRCKLRMVLAYLQLIEWNLWSQCFPGPPSRKSAAQSTKRQANGEQHIQHLKETHDKGYNPIQSQ